jgi:hypothetical protein
MQIVYLIQHPGQLPLIHIGKEAENLDEASRLGQNET